MPRRKGTETMGAAKPSATSSTRTRRARNKPPDEGKAPSPLESQSQTSSVKTPLTRVKKPVAGFPDRLNWKMTHLTMPTTSTPKVDLTARKVTERDVDTAFGFDDSCNGDLEANYSTLISPIAHCNTGTGGLNVWKINPLTQRNVEIEPPKPISRTEQENVPERRSTRKGSTRRKPQFPEDDTQDANGANVPERRSTPEDETHDANGANVAERRRTRNREKPDDTQDANGVNVPERRSTRKKSQFPEDDTHDANGTNVPEKRSTRKRSRKMPLFPEDTHDANGASPFSALLEKYNEDKPTSVELEGELHVDPKKIIRTYGSRKRVKFSEDRETEYDFMPSTNVELHSEPEKAGRSKRQPNSKKRTKSKKENDMDEEVDKWLEEKNKEFEDVLKAPLVIENSFSD